MIDPKTKAIARNYAFRLLRERPRSEKEMRSRLKLKGFDSEHIDDVVASLKKAGQIDDSKFAKFFMESRMHMNPVGDIVLKHDLKRKGIEPKIIEQVIDDKHLNYNELDTALKMAEERFKRLKGLDRKKASKRIYDFLLRRGFEYDTVRRVIEKLAVSMPQRGSIQLDQDEGEVDEVS